MKILLTGGTGFIGRHLVRALLERGDDCVVVSRRDANPWDDDRVRLVRGDPTRSGPWQSALGGADAVINLAGALLVDPPHRWTTARKQEIRASRVQTTLTLVEGMRAAAPPPRVLLSGSAVGYYGAHGDTPLDETAPPGSDFLAQLCVEWENAARTAPDGIRVVLLRTAPVLGPGGGVLQPMLTPFKLGVGGAWGSGTQWWSWVHIADVVGIVLFALDREIAGAVNVTAPTPVRVTEFVAALGDVLGRPTFARIPEFALRLALGEAAETLLASLRVLPRRVQDGGYAHRFPELRPALAHVLGR